MTPQELINLPGWGQANNRVKAMGCWRETMTDEERIEWIDENDATVRWTGFDEVWDVHETSHASPLGALRVAIDTAAMKLSARECAAYLDY